MEFECILENDIVVFALSGKVMSCEDARPIRAKIKGYIEQGTKKFIFDMGDVPWINSEGVGLIAMSVSTIFGAGGKLVLTGAGEKVKKVLEITRCDSIIDQYDNRTDAIRSLAD